MVEILIIVCCLALNALLAAYEMAFVSVSKSELRRLARAKNKKAKKILQLRDSPERTLSIIQVGITLVGAIAAAVGGAGAAENLEPYFTQLGLKEVSAEIISVALIVLPLTYLSVVMGELVPKTIALRHSRQIVLAGARALFIGDRLLAPIVTLLEQSTKFILKLFTHHIPREAALPNDEAINIENLSPIHQRFMINMANLEKVSMLEIMEPWNEVVSVESDAPGDSVTRTILLSGHTRLPVVRDQKVIGILHAKEFLTWRASGEDEWTPLIRDAYEVRAADLALSVLRVMQERHAHMAIIVDVLGMPQGIVTLEDILEEVVGEIFDEDDDGLIRKLFTSRARAERFLAKKKKTPGA